MKEFSYLTNSHPSYIEELYNDFVANPDSIDPDLKKFFEGFDFAAAHYNGNSSSSTAATASITNDENVDWAKEFAVFTMIRAYRKRGHLLSKTNPIRSVRIVMQGLH